MWFLSLGFVIVVVVIYFGCDVRFACVFLSVYLCLCLCVFFNVQQGKFNESFTISMCIEWCKRLEFLGLLIFIHFLHIFTFFFFPPWNILFPSKLTFISMQLSSVLFFFFSHSLWFVPIFLYAYFIMYNDFSLFR